MVGYTPNKSKHGGDKGGGLVLSDGTVEGGSLVEPAYGSEEHEDS